MRVGASRILVQSLLLCVIFLLSISSVWAGDFVPLETPLGVTASTSSSSTTFTLPSAIDAPLVKVCNNGTQIVYWACGNSSVQACVPGNGCASTQMGAGLCGAYYKGVGATACAAITATGSSPVTFTAGSRQ